MFYILVGNISEEELCNGNVRGRTPAEAIHRAEHIIEYWWGRDANRSRAEIFEQLKTEELEFSLLQINEEWPGYAADDFDGEPEWIASGVDVKDVEEVADIGKVYNYKLHDPRFLY